MGRRNEKLRNKFLESPTHAAMLEAIFPQAVFIPKCPQVKAQVSLQSAHLHCYVLGLTQGAFFIFHLLTKHFPSHDQPPIHLDHMTNHLTTHMTNHMPFQSPAPQSHLSYITCSQVTCTSPDTPSPDLT